MRRLSAAVIFAGAAQVSLAQPVMTPESCLSGWQAFTFAIGTPARFRAIQPDVTEDGWCQIDRSIADLRANDFGRVMWWADGVEDAVANSGFPLSFEAEFTGIDLVEAFNMNLPGDAVGTMGALLMKAMRDPATRDFAVEAVSFDFAELGALGVAFQGGGIDLSGLSQMQLSLGGLRVHSAQVSFETTKALSAALWPVIGDEEFWALLRDTVALIPEANLDADGRAALLRFFAAGADAEGCLDVKMSSETGLGFLQVLGGALAFDKGDEGPDALMQALEQILTGVTLSATWASGG